MQELILYIKSKVISGNQNIQQFTRVDLMDAELITLTQVIQDVKEIDKIFTDFSRTFNLPASKNNNRIFKHWYNDDVIGFDNTIMSDAIIELNHLPFKEGEIKLEEVVMKNNKPSIYKVTFFGKTVSLNNLIGNDKLNNLSWLSNFDFQDSDSNIKIGFGNGFDVTVDSVTYTDAIIYPLIAHSQQYIFNSNGDTDNINNISSSGANNTKRGIFAEDLKPAIKVSLILKAIEQQYGLIFKSGEFFDSSVFTNMYLWLHREKGKIKSRPQIITIDDPRHTCFEASQFPDSCTYFGQSPHKFDDGKLIFEKSNFETELLYEFEVQPADNTIEYTIEIVDALTNTILSSSTGTGFQEVEVKFDIFGNFTPFNNGDKFEFVSRVKCNQNFTFTIPGIKCQVGFIPTDTDPVGTFQSIFQYGSSSFATSGQALSIVNNVPEINVLDFLKGLFKMHNLTAFVNTNNEIVVKTLDNFYSGDTIDISKFVVTDQHTIGADLPFTEIDFEYAEPKTILAQEFLQENNIKFGELNFKTNASTESKFKINVPFEHMMFERLNDLSDNSQTDILYGTYLDDDLNPTIGAPLIFYALNTAVGEDVNFIENLTRPSDGSLPSSTGTRSGVLPYWRPCNYNEEGSSSTPPDFNLNFGSEINEFTLTDYNGENNSLFQLYYKNYILRILNKKTRLYKVKAILPLKELLKISLDDTLIIGTREFTINKMTTKLQSGETQLELLSKV